MFGYPHVPRSRLTVCIFHTPAVDIRSGSLYCSGCEDIIYDQTFDDLHHSTLLAEEENATKFQSESS